MGCASKSQFIEIQNPIKKVTLQQHGLGVNKGCLTWRGTYNQN